MNARPADGAVPLGELQQSLVEALLLGGACPPGVDADAVAATRRQLLDKRARVVAAHRPTLAACLGERWPDDFVAWADGRAPAGGSVDGFRFAAAVADGRAGPASLTPGCADELAELLLTWRESRSGLVRRHGVRAATVRGVRIVALGRLRRRLGLPRS